MARGLWVVPAVLVACLGVVAAQVTVSIPVRFEETGEMVGLQFTEGQDMLATVTNFCNQVRTGGGPCPAVAVAAPLRTSAV